MKVVFGEAAISLVQGDITRLAVDAVVNAANPQLAGGGGVDGAIHAAAGPALMRETQQRYPEGCPVGSAVATAGGQLLAKHVFHAVGPIWRGGREGEEALLRSAFRRCLELAVEHQCRSIAFPAISTGVYAYPLDLAAEQSLDELRRFVITHQRPADVRMVLFSEGSYSAFARVLEAMAS